MSFYTYPSNLIPLYRYVYLLHQSTPFNPFLRQPNLTFSSSTRAFPNSSRKLFFWLPLYSHIRVSYFASTVLLQKPRAGYRKIDARASLKSETILCGGVSARFLVFIFASTFLFKSDWRGRRGNQRWRCASTLFPEGWNQATGALTLRSSTPEPVTSHACSLLPPPSQCPLPSSSFPLQIPVKPPHYSSRSPPASAAPPLLLFPPSQTTSTTSSSILLFLHLPLG